MSNRKPLDEKIKAQVELQRKMKILESHMKALIESTVQEDRQVKIVPGKEEWAYDPNRSEISYATEGPLNIFQLTDWEVMSTLFHEIAHARYTEGLDMSSLVVPEPKKDYATFLNIFEDIRIERKLANRFPGTEDGFHTIAKKQQALINEDLYEKLPPNLNLLLNLRQKEQGFNYKFKDAETERTFFALEDKFEGAYKVNSSTELHEYLMKEIWPVYSTLIPTPPPPGSSEQPDSEGDQEGQASEEPQSGSGSGESPPEQKEQEGDFDKEQFDKDLDDVQEMGELLNAMIKHSNKEDESEEQEASETLIQKLDRESEEKPSEEQVSAKSHLIDPDIEEAIRENDDDDFKTYEELFEDIRPYYNFFRQKLNSIMEDNRLSRHGGSYNSGTLQNNTLYKWKTKNYRVFGKPVMRQNRDYAVTLLVDESGSMDWNDKNLNAARGAVLLSEVLNAIKIPFEIRGFNDTTRIYKNFSQPFDWSVKRSLENIIPSTKTNAAGHNNDGYAINWSMVDLNKQVGQKILIVLSDGEPAPSYRSVPQADQKRLKRRGEFSTYQDFDIREEIKLAKRDAVLIGVGIGAEHVAKYYPESAICDDVSELPRMVLNILRKHIKRG